MIFCPQIDRLLKSLVPSCIAASLFLYSAPAATAASPADEIAAAGQLYFDGKAITARERLERLLDRAPDLAPAERLRALGTLLDICIRSQADPCVANHAQAYLDTVLMAPPTDAGERRDLARRAGYYLDHALLTTGSRSRLETLPQSLLWREESVLNPVLYLQRQELAARVYLQLGRRADLARVVDKTLSLVAAANNPRALQPAAAQAISNALAVLLALGDTDRAYGVYRASGEYLLKGLAPLTLDAVKFRLTETELLQKVGASAAALAAADAAIQIAERIELDPEVRSLMVASALDARAALCTASGDLACAADALKSHPAAALYARPGRTPAAVEEVTYLGTRALLTAAEGREDAVAAQALSQLKLESGPLDAYRALGVALATRAGPERREAMLDAARRIHAAGAAAPDGEAFGTWRRPGQLERLSFLLVLGALDPADRRADAAAFGLFQLSARVDQPPDADALTVLGEARTELQRRSIHQALRLRARRDRLERAELAKLASRPSDGVGHDSRLRLSFRDFSRRLEAVRGELDTAGVPASGALLADLPRFQAALRPGEAALALAPVVDGMSYICIRRDAVFRATGPADLARARLDQRLLQQALTAGHPPSESADSQYPVEAAVRLYDLLIRPFEPCLRPGDHIVWLPGVAVAKVPLAALLRSPPPRAGQGWDLSKAEWLALRHPISYAGSASAVLAARSAAVRPPADFDFLGVGDPLLKGPAAEAAGLNGFEPLPETRDELEQTARAFNTATVLTGSDATERRFRSQLIGSYRFLSFATHGLLRDDVEGLAEPALVLTPVAGGGLADDGLLTASEIADLNLAARFVALSACNTANYDSDLAARELPALASAFAVAGAPSTLATLWSVDSGTSRRLVAEVFAAVGAGAGSADALAKAQRAFLAAPPGKAYLHPRFWAAFVILGDGGPSPPARVSGARIAKVERLTRAGAGGEVLALARSRGGLAARYIGDPNPGGRRGSGVALSGGAGWRAEDPAVGAASELLDLGPSLLSAGYVASPAGRYVPTLETLDPVSGRAQVRWRGEPLGGLDTVVAGSLRTGPGLALLVLAAGDVSGSGQAGARLEVHAVDSAVSPRRLFAVDLRASVRRVDEATLTQLGRNLLLTYTERFSALVSARMTEDEFDQPICASEPVTWIELREAATGRLLQSREVRGLVVRSALAQDGRAVLAGSSQSSCEAEARATVLGLGPDLDPKPLYTDSSLGGSEARSLAARSGGGLAVAAHKQNVVDYRREGGAADRYRLDDLSAPLSGMLVLLDQKGALAGERMLDSGFDVFVSAANAGPGEVAVGGSLGGDAAIFHIAAP